MLRILKKVSLFKERLVVFGEHESLGALSLAVILLLDLFVLSVLFNGLDEHTAQLTSPEEYIPMECREALVSRTWNEANLLDQTQTLTLSGYNSMALRYQGRLQEADTENMHTACRRLFVQLRLIAKDDAVKQLFIDRQQIKIELTIAQGQISVTKDAYDSAMLGRLANGNSPSNVAGLQSDIEKRTAVVDALTAELSRTDAQLMASPLLVGLADLIARDDEARLALVADYKNHQLYYKLKEFLWQALFLLPLFFIFYFWGGYSAKRQHHVQTLIASHLLVVVSIPIMLKVITLVVDLIPQHFFREMFRVLEKLHIIAIWHYLVILAAVAAGLWLVFLIQKKLFDARRLQLRRLARGQCHDCGRRLPAEASVCPFCGAKQLINCRSCGQPTYRSGNFCIHCGQPMAKEAQR